MFLSIENGDRLNIVRKLTSNEGTALKPTKLKVLTVCLHSSSQTSGLSTFSLELHTDIQVRKTVTAG